MKKTKKNLKPINIFLKDKTHNLAKICAVLKKTTLKNYIMNAINESIEKEKNLLNGL